MWSKWLFYKVERRRWFDLISLNCFFLRLWWRYGLYYLSQKLMNLKKPVSDEIKKIGFYGFSWTQENIFVATFLILLFCFCAVALCKLSQTAAKTELLEDHFLLSDDSGFGLEFVCSSLIHNPLCCTVWPIWHFQSQQQSVSLLILDP